ncbi:MAG: exosome complex protein Rrp42 [Candidatus Bathyarchaeia archaeon]
MSINVIPQITRERILELAGKGRRIDGRALNQYRPIRIERGLIKKADGSAQVSIGSTKVLVGVKIETGEPFPDTPDQGVLMVNAELVPLASPTFEPGPPNEDALELARVVDRGLRESKCLRLEDLCINPGRKVFVVFVDIYVLDYDGNLFDASALASIAALMDAKMKPYRVEAGEVLWLEGEPSPLNLQHYPVSVTIAKAGGALFVDPSLEEEQSVDTLLTITMDEQNRLCAIQKGPGSFTPEEVFKSVQIAKEVSNYLRESLKRRE